MTNPLNFAAPFMDMAGSGLTELFNFGLRGAASSTYGTALDQTAPRVNDMGEWAGQYGFGQTTEAGQANQNSFNQYTQQRQDMLPFVMGQWGGARDTFQANQAGEAGAWQNIQNQAGADRATFDRMNADMMAAGKENYQFMRNMYADVTSQAKADTQRIMDLGSTAIGDVSTRVDNAIKTRVNTVGEQMKSVAAQATAQKEQAKAQLDQAFYSGSMSEAQYQQGLRELDRNTALATGNGQISLMAAQNDAFVRDQMQGAQLVSDVRAQFANLEGQMRSAGQSATIGAAGQVNQGAVSYLTVLGQGASNQLAGAKFSADVNGNAALAMERRTAARTAFDTGEIAALTDAFSNDQKTLAAVEQWRENLTSTTAANNANAAANFFSLVSAAGQFTMAGEANRAGLIAGMALNPDSFSGFSEALYNVQMLNNAGGGSQSDSGGFPGSGVGALGGMAVGGALGGPVGAMEGGIEGGLLGSMFG